MVSDVFSSLGLRVSRSPSPPLCSRGSRRRKVFWFLFHISSTSRVQLGLSADGLGWQNSESGNGGRGKFCSWPFLLTGCWLLAISFQFCNPFAFWKALTLNPPSSPFSKGEKSGIFYRRPWEKLSSLWKREAGRDLWESILKKPNWYPVSIFVIG